MRVALGGCTGEKRQKCQLLGFFSFGTHADVRKYRLGVPATLRALLEKCVTTITIKSFFYRYRRKDIETDKRQGFP